MSDLDNKKILKFGYEDTDKKIEIELYGLVFEIRNIDNIEELKKVEKSDKNEIETQIEKILGEGAIEKINNKRIADGHDKLSLNVELNIIGCIFEAYGKKTFKNMSDKVVGTINDISEDMNNLGNREQRRNFNRNNRGYRKYRRY